MIRPPWSKRRTEDDIKSFYVLRKGIPDGLYSSLFTFVTDHAYARDPYSGDFHPNKEVLERFARVTETYLPADPVKAGKLFGENPVLLLDAVDFILGILNPIAYDVKREVRSLTTKLEESRSAYTIGVDGDGRYQLQDRQPEELTKLVEVAASATDRASEHLRRAWAKAFARTPDPNGACVEGCSGDRGGSEADRESQERQGDTRHDPP